MNGYPLEVHPKFILQVGKGSLLDSSQYDPRTAHFREGFRVVPSTPLLSTQPSLTPPVNVVYHTVDPAALSAAYDCVSDTGYIVTALHTEPLDRKPKVTFVSVRGFIAGAEVFVPGGGDNGLGLVATTAHTQFGKLIMKNLPEMLEKGNVVANRYQVLPNGIAGVIDGMERLQQDRMSGVKVVAHPQNPIAL
ncbi:hypothetical protein C8R47DRAFT_1226922 [Mycena vitilis]|nr:hypothetical protein C8R47DRAFT_1226922 [Mycena vitilis]